MRSINYKVRKADGTEFHTMSYKEATNDGNHIKEIYLTETNERAGKGSCSQGQKILKAKKR